jgi:hypothetical protein
MSNFVSHTIIYSLDELKNLINSPQNNMLMHKIRRYIVVVLNKT